MKHHIRYANINDSHVLGNIHSESFRTAYKEIISDNILNNFTAEKREKYIRKSLEDKNEEYFLILKENKSVGFMCIGAEMKIWTTPLGKFGAYIYYRIIGTKA